LCIKQENPPEDEAQLVEKILGMRMGKRPVLKMKEEIKEIVNILCLHLR
jgi:hypothetical protein